MVLRPLLLLAILATPTLGQVATEAELHTDPVGVSYGPPTMPLTVADKARLDLLEAEIGARDALDAMARYNRDGNLPPQNGVARTLFDGITLDPNDANKAAGVSGWTARVGIPGAFRLRLRLDVLDLPEGAKLWVAGVDEGPVGFGAELIDEAGGLWTPSVGGESITLHVEWPDGLKPALRISEAMQLFATGNPFGGAPEKTACLRDATCVGNGEFSGIVAARGAVAHIQFVKNGSGFVCSGGLLNDTNPNTVVPLFLLANHCFSSQSSASSIEAFWDYKSANCNGNWPSLGSLQKSNGSTLLATSSSTDVTLVRLNSIPAGRWLLGWDARTQILTQHLRLHRLSHPFPDGFNVPGSQAYSRMRLSTSSPTCTGINRPQYLYSVPENGGQYGGSSGAPVMIDSGQVVGQLRGACGPNPSNGCDYSNYVVDGSLAQSWALLSPHLDPQITTTTPCVANSTTLCVNNNTNDKRFEVKINFRTTQTTGQGTAISTNSLGITRGGMFWFFQPDNPELLVKVLNGCGVNQRFWVFYAATTNVEFTMTVRDVQAGVTKSYFNPLNNPAPPVLDTSAFATCP
jgi:hypothetical protein